MKTNELTGAELDYWVAKAEGLDPQENERGDFFGYERLKRIVSQYTHKDVHEIVNEIFIKSETFTNSVEQSDDITIQIMKVK